MNQVSFWETHKSFNGQGKHSKGEGDQWEGYEIKAMRISCL